MKQLCKTGLLLVFVGMVSGSLWPPGTEVVYDYEADLDTITKYPEESSSQWALKGKLVVQGGQDSVTVQLQDLQIATYTGPTYHHTHLVYTPPPEEAKQLLHPFVLHVEEGKLTGLSVEAGEDDWAVNMKRGIVGLLQLDPSALKKPTFTATENILYGTCKVDYSSQESGDKTVNVSKSIDYSTCTGSSKKGFLSSLASVCNTANPKPPVDVTSIRSYYLKPLGPSQELLIAIASADGGVHFQPFNYNSEAYYVSTWVEIKLKTVDAIKEPLSVAGGVERVGLKYEQPVGDVSQGRSRPSQQELISAVTKVLHELGESLDPPGLETNLVKLHEERVAYVLYFLSLLNHTSLSQLYSDLAVGTSYQHETYRNLLFELLPLVGTHDAVLLVRDLVMGGTIKNDTAADLLIALPFSLRHASEQLLKDLEVLLTVPEDSGIYNSAVLTFASLVGLVCQSGCAAETQDKYVEQYLENFIGSMTPERQLLYVQALSNFKLKRVAQYFEPIIQGTDFKFPTRIRLLALWLPEDIGYLTPEKSFELYWPILSGQHEPLELRVSALVILTKNSPNVARFYQLQVFMLEETNPHLRHFWYTMLQSIVHTNHHFHHLVELAKKAVRFYPEPDSHHSLSGHYTFGYTHPEYGFGSLAQLYTVDNPETGGPLVVALYVGSNIKLCNYLSYVIYLRFEGVGDIMKRAITKNILKVDKILELLKQLEVPTKEAEPLRIDMVIEAKGRTISTISFNETSYHTLLHVLKNVPLLTSGGIHVNAQNIFVPFLLEEKGPTDLGTTALLRITHSLLTSLRANFTTGRTVLSQMDFRSYLSSQTALTQYNPVLNMWHGVQRSLNLQYIFPFDLEFSAQLQKDHIKFSILHKPDEEAGVVGHVETAALVRGITAEEKLKSHCQSCSSYHVIKKHNDHPKKKVLSEVTVLGSELSLSLLDCEHSCKKEDFLSAIRYASEHQDSDLVPSLGPLLTLSFVYDTAVLVPPSGSCGYLLQATPLIDEPTQVDVEVILNTEEKSHFGSSTGDYGAQVLVKSNTSSSWEINLHYSPSKHQLKTNLSSDSGLIGSLSIRAQFPEPVEEVTFLSDKDPHSAHVDISATWHDSDIHISLNGEVTKEQQEQATDPSKWPYETCQKDLHDTDEWGDTYAPLTPACYAVAKELATLRKYNFSVSANDLPSWLSFLPEDNVTVEVEVPKDSRATLHVNGYKKTLSSEQTHHLQSMLINTHFPPLLQLATRRGQLGSCVVTTKSVWTVDGLNHDTHLGSCYSLAIADCSDTPQFALFVKKSDSKWYPLAFKLYVGDDVLEIVPREHKFKIYVNDVEVAHPEQGYLHPPWSSIYHFRVWERADGLVRIYMPISRSWIEYYGHFATVTVPGLYKGEICGICGNFNRDPKDDSAHLYTIPCAG